MRRPQSSRGEVVKVLVDRLSLSSGKLASMIAGVRAVADLPDPSRPRDRAHATRHWSGT